MTPNAVQNKSQKISVYTTEEPRGRTLLVMMGLLSHEPGRAWHVIHHIQTVWMSNMRLVSDSEGGTGSFNMSEREIRSSFICTGHKNWRENRMHVRERGGWVIHPWITKALTNCHFKHRNRESHFQFNEYFQKPERKLTPKVSPSPLLTCLSLETSAGQSKKERLPQLHYNLAWNIEFSRHRSNWNHFNTWQSWPF